MKISLITACLAGVAHSKMAAAAIKKEAEAMGITIDIEEQGGHKIPVRLTQAQIDSSDVVIVAKAVSISGKERLAGKKVLDVSVNIALRNPKAILLQAIELINESGNG